MGLIYKRMILQGDRSNKEVTTLFDTGASQCFARKDIAEQVATIAKAPTRLKFEAATGVVETQEVIFAQIWLDRNPLFWTFYVLPDLTEELILGSDFFQRWKIRIDPEQEKITLDPSALKLKLV
jgi:predicted aspartyl protease